MNNRFLSAVPTAPSFAFCSRWVFFLLFLLGCLAAYGQQSGPYYLSLKQEMLYGGGGAGTVVLGGVLRARTPDIMRSDLRLGEIPKFDRIATRLSSDQAKQASNLALYASAGAPLLLMAGKETRRDVGKIALLFGETMVINQGLTNIIKSSALRPRPYVFDENLPPSTVIRSNDRASFLSGHTSTSAAGAFFFGRVFADYYPDSKLKPYVWGLAAGLPALTGYLRIRAGQHYPSDIIAGYALGATIGYLVPTLHKKPIGGRRLTMSPTGSGVYLAYRLE